MVNRAWRSTLLGKLFARVGLGFPAEMFAGFGGATPLDGADEATDPLPAADTSPFPVRVKEEVEEEEDNELSMEG